MKGRLFGALIVLAFTAQPVLAHHSFAMFDRNKQITIKGKVKEWLFTNPHAWIELMVANDKGGTDQWNVECGAVTGMVRQGFRPNTLRPGDQVSITINPLKDGTHGGSLVQLTLADGKKMGSSPQPLAQGKEEVSQ
jgi:hypothetical protein